ncbi:MAG: hypothetical protein QOG17_1652, partial [Gammaproteobacteria bacterium]|nr:hypothetical protein [Gammaproteobacteria bacterium]
TIVLASTPSLHGERRRLRHGRTRRYAPKRRDYAAADSGERIR